jgi:hypothetical protein
MSDDEHDIAAILDLPLEQSEGTHIMDDDSKVANAVINIDMTGNEDVTRVNMQGTYTGVKEEDTFAKEELPTNNNTHLHGGKYVPTFKHSEAYKVACKKDVPIETNLKEMKTVTYQNGTETLDSNTYQQAMNETYQEKDVDETHPNINIMRVCTNKPPGTTTFGVEELHPRKKEEDHFAREELPADNKVLAKYEYGGKPDVQDSIDLQDMPNVPPKEELPANDGILTEYEYSHNRNVRTSQTETLDVTKMLAYLDENYNIPSQMGDEDEPNADLEREEEPNVRENPYSINEIYQEEDVANHEQTNGVANKKESRGSP